MLNSTLRRSKDRTTAKVSFGIPIKMHDGIPQARAGRQKQVPLWRGRTWCGSVTTKVFSLYNNVLKSISAAMLSPVDIQKARAVHMGDVDGIFSGITLRPTPVLILQRFFKWGCSNPRG